MSVCGSDLGAYRLHEISDRWLPPLVLGHEFAGEIARLGQGVQGLSLGQVVTANPILYCGHCYYCRHGQINFCPNRHSLGTSIGGIRHDGAMQEYMTVRASAVIPLLEGVNVKQGALLEQRTTVTRAALCSAWLQRTIPVPAPGVTAMRVSPGLEDAMWQTGYPVFGGYALRSDLVLRIEGLLAEAWRQGDDTIYSVPARSDSLAHVMGAADLVATQPIHGLDVAGLERYVAALENVSLKGLRIGVPREYFIEGIQKGVEDAVRTALRVLEDLGATTQPVSLPHTDYALPTYYLLAPAEASANLARYDGVKYGYRAENSDEMWQVMRETRGDGFGTEVKRRIMLGTYALSAGYYDAYYKKALQVRRLAVGVAHFGQGRAGKGGRVGLSARGRGRAWVKASCAWSDRRALRLELWCSP